MLKVLDFVVDLVLMVAFAACLPGLILFAIFMAVLDMLFSC